MSNTYRPLTWDEEAEMLLLLELELAREEWEADTAYQEMMEEQYAFEIDRHRHD
jgi:hypothetical protein